jgi:hypothetical protein
LASPRKAFLKEEKSSMRGVRLTLNECHRNWRFYKLWLLIGLSFAILAMSYVIKAATGKRGDDQKSRQNELTFLLLAVLDIQLSTEIPRDRWPLGHS